MRDRLRGARYSRSEQWEQKYAPGSFEKGGMQLEAIAGSWQAQTGLKGAMFAPQRGAKDQYAILERVLGEVVSAITESSLYQGGQGARIGVGPDEDE